MFTPKAGNVKVVATFKKNVTKKTATLYVAYVDENAHQVGTTQQKITKEGNDGENYTFNITNLNVPDGYELVTATWEKSVAYGDEEFVNVTVKKKEAKKADAVLRVHYVDENGTPLDGSQYIVSLTKNGTVGEKATFAATSFTAPEGYELVGDVTDVEVAYGKDKDVNVKVKDIKEVFIKFGMNGDISELSIKDIIKTTKSDKKMVGDKIKFILLHSIGEAYIDMSVTDDEMENALKK